MLYDSLYALYDLLSDVGARECSRGHVCSWHATREAGTIPERVRAGRLFTAVVLVSFTACHWSELRKIEDYSTVEVWKCGSWQWWTEHGPISYSSSSGSSEREISKHGIEANKIRCRRRRRGIECLPFNNMASNSRLPAARRAVEGAEKTRPISMIEVCLVLCLERCH